MSFPALTVRRPVINVWRNAILHLVFVNLVRHRRAGDAGDGLFLLNLAAIAAHRPKLFPLLGKRVNEHGAVELSTAARDVHHTFDLQCLSSRYLIVLKLVRMWIC